MADDNAERKRRLHNPRSRRPAGPPPRVDEVLESYNDGPVRSDGFHEGDVVVIRRPTEAEATAVKKEITAAEYYLQTWEHRNIRVRPYITEQYDLDGVEYTYRRGTEAAPASWYPEDDPRTEYSVKEFKGLIASAKKVDHYWLVRFQAHDPMPRGLRQMSKEQRDAILRRSAASRGVDITLPGPESRPAPKRRSVEVRGDEGTGQKRAS